jgi:hypothetical protein
MTTQGALTRVRARLFGQRDPVDDQLRDIARQGSGMARAAHACALLLIVLFSLGSLVALGGDALSSILALWQSGHAVETIPSAISVAVSTLLVVCCDVGMVYAAGMLRILAARRADGGEKRVHQLVMLTVAALEAATYAYMSWRYESPATAVAWALIMARALAAPLLSVYLATARPLPVTARDILHEVELASGKGVIRDAVTIANDANAALSEKMALYGAAATMRDADRARLDAMMAAMHARTDIGIAPDDADSIPAPAQTASGVGTPQLNRPSGRSREPVLRLLDRPKLTAAQRVRRVLARKPDASLDDIAARAHVSKPTAKKYRDEWLREQQEEAR